MAQVLKHYIKLVLFLFISSQVQGDTETTLQELETSTPQEEVDGNRDIENDYYNPYWDIYHQWVQTQYEIDNKIQSKLRESYPKIAEMRQELKDHVNKFIIGNEEITFAHDIYLMIMMGQVNEFLDFVAKDSFSDDQETLDKISFITEQIKRIENNINKIVMPISEHINNIHNKFITKTKPITKEWAPLIKKVGDAILTLIPDEKDESMNTNVNHTIDE